MSAAPDAEVELPRPAHYDLRATLRMLAIGGADPTMTLARDEVWRATFAPDCAPVTWRAVDDGAALRVAAWGPGAAWAVEAAPGLLGLRDEPAALVSDHPAILDLVWRFPGLRLSDTGQVTQSLLPTILRQLVTWIDAARSWRALTLSHGEVAPGPAGLRLPPAPSTLASLPGWAYRAAGVGARQAETMRAVARRARSLDRLRVHPPPELARRLRTLPGLGPWTVQSALGGGLGWPDAVPTGDYHLPNSVAWLLAGEARADDARMLELLAPFAGQRYRVIRLIFAAGATAPKFGPKSTPRSRR